VNRRKDIVSDGLANIAVIAAGRKKSSAGAVPVVFRSAKNALRKINGALVTVRPGSVLIASESA